MKRICRNCNYYGNLKESKKKGDPEGFCFNTERKYGRPVLSDEQSCGKWDEIPHVKSAPGEKCCGMCANWHKLPEKEQKYIDVETGDCDRFPAGSFSVCDGNIYAGYAGYAADDGRYAKELGCFRARSEI